MAIFAFGMPDPIWLIMKFKQTSSPVVPSSLRPRFDLGRLLAFRISENDAGKEFIRNGKGAERKGHNYFDVNPNIDLQSSI
jgi:hypothetical protein